MPKSNLWIDVPKLSDGTITVGSRFEVGGKKSEALWFKFSDELGPYLSHSNDAFLIADIFRIMQAGHDCHVHGTVSPSLLRNLAEFQAAWACWRPDLYKQVEITADAEREFDSLEPDAPCIATFTGGVDSTYTIYRHCAEASVAAGSNAAGARNNHSRRNIEAALFVHGFDIKLEQHEAFQRAAKRAERVLSSINCKLITMATNLKQFNPNWNEHHVAGIASAMTLLSGRYTEGLIASGCSYNGLLIPWGSNPITDHLLSSANFRITHDGAGLRRSQKLKVVAEGWKVGFENLWVCFKAERRDENCGTCPKCVMTILGLRILNIQAPPSFPELKNEALARLGGVTSYEMDTWRFLRQAARDGGITDDWVEILSKRVDELEKEISSTDSKVRLITPGMSEARHRWFSRKRLSGLLNRTFSRPNKDNN